MSKKRSRKPIATFFIGPHRIPVLEDFNLRVSGDPVWGFFNSRDNEILLDAAMNSQRWWSTLFHELAHACHIIIGRAGADDNESWDRADERMADAVGIGFSQNVQEIARLMKSRPMR